MTVLRTDELIHDQTQLLDPEVVLPVGSEVIEEPARMAYGITAAHHYQFER